MIRRPPLSPLFPYTTLFRSNHRVAADRSIARIRVVNQKSARSRKHSWASRDMMKASESLLRCVERLRKLRTRFGSNSPSRYVSGRADELVFHTQLEGVDLREVVGLTQGQLNGPTRTLKRNLRQTVSTPTALEA